MSLDRQRIVTGDLTDGQRDGFDCVDCGAVMPHVMRPVGVLAGFGQVFSCCPMDGGVSDR